MVAQSAVKTLDGVRALSYFALERLLSITKGKGNLNDKDLEAALVQVARWNARQTVQELLPGDVEPADIRPDFLGSDRTGPNTLADGLFFRLPDTSAKLAAKGLASLAKSQPSQSEDQERTLDDLYGLAANTLFSDPAFRAALLRPQDSSQGTLPQPSPTVSVPLPAAVQTPSSAPFPTPSGFPELGAKIDHRYEIVEPLRAGGMGQLFTSRTADGTVALKVLRPGLGTIGHRRFEREGILGTSLSSNARFPRVHAHGRCAESGHCYIAMDLIQGHDLKDIMATTPKHRLVDVITQTLEGLTALHDLGAIHRDVNPRNIRIQDDGSVKILDLGIAKVTGETLTEEGSPATAGYVAPEQLDRTAPISPATDVYLVGLTAYEAIAGTPFRSGTWHSCRLWGFNAEIERSLQADPRLRYQSANDFLAALREAQGDYMRVRQLTWVLGVVLIALIGAVIALFLRSRATDTAVAVLQSRLERRVKSAVWLESIVGHHMNSNFKDVPAMYAMFDRIGEGGDPVAVTPAKWTPLSADRVVFPGVGGSVVGATWSADRPGVLVVAGSYVSGINGVGVSNSNKITADGAIVATAVAPGDTPKIEIWLPSDSATFLQEPGRWVRIFFVPAQ